MKRLIAAFIGIAAIAVGAQVFPFPPFAFVVIDSLVPRPDIQCHTGIDIHISKTQSTKLFRVDLRDFKIGLCNGTRLIQPQNPSMYSNYRSYLASFDGMDTCGAVHYSSSRTLGSGQRVFFTLIDQRMIKLTCARQYAPSGVVVTESLQTGAPRYYFMPRQ